MSNIFWWVFVESYQLTSTFLQALHTFSRSQSRSHHSAYLIPVVGLEAYSLWAKILLQSFLFTSKIERNGGPSSMEICEGVILVMIISLVHGRKKFADRIEPESQK